VILKNPEKSRVMFHFATGFSMYRLSAQKEEVLTRNGLCQENLHGTGQEGVTL